MLDSRGRRFRWRARNPQGTCLITPRDHIVFETIERHGHLPSKYLHYFATGEWNAFQKRLSTLFDHGYLERFDDQKDSFRNRLRHIVYGNTEKSRALISERVERNDRFTHRLFGACVSASIEQGTSALELTYLPRNVVLKGKSLRMPLGEKTYLEPDDLFGVKNQQGKVKRFAVEIDRATEPLEGKNRHSSIEKKLDYYHDVIKNRLYDKGWGIPGMMVMVITTSNARIHNIIEMLKGYNDPAFASRFLFKAYPTFNENWLVPTDLLTDILDPWQSVDKLVDIAA